MSIEVFVADEQSDHPVDSPRWDNLARAVLKAEKVKGDTELSVLFVDEATIAGLNQRFLGKSGPTDVLAFPLDEDPDEPDRERGGQQGEPEAPGELDGQPPRVGPEHVEDPMGEVDDAHEPEDDRQAEGDEDEDAAVHQADEQLRVPDLEREAEEGQIRWAFRSADSGASSGRSLHPRTTRRSSRR